MRRFRGFAFGGVLCLVLLCASPAQASTLTFAALTDPGSITQTGTFEHDDDLAIFAFILTVDATFYASTSDGPAGLDPLLTLFSVDSGGLLKWMTDNDDTEPGVNVEATLFDPLLGTPGVLLSAGSYLLVLSQTWNYSDQTGNFLGDPLYTCDPTLTGNPDPAACVAAGGFEPTDPFTPTGRTFSVTYGITEPGAPAPVPEPGTLALLGTGVAALVARRRKY